MSNQDNLNKYYDEFCESQQIDEINPKKRYGKQKTTFAMYLAQKGIIPPKEQEHDLTIQNDYGYTDPFYLEINGIETPQQWRYQPTPKYSFGNSLAMLVAKEGKIVSKYWNHDPLLTNNLYKRIVAIFLAKQGVIPPKQWYHDPKLKDDTYLGGKTVQDYLKEKNIKVPPEWKVN